MPRRPISLPNLSRKMTEKSSALLNLPEAVASKAGSASPAISTSADGPKLKASEKSSTNRPLDAGDMEQAHEILKARIDSGERPPELVEPCRARHPPRACGYAVLTRFCLW